MLEILGVVKTHCQVFALCLVLCSCGPSGKQACQENQAFLWDAAGSYCVERRAVPTDTIDPRQLKSFLRGRDVPKCPLGTSDYSPFKLFDGPKCPHEGSGHGKATMPRKVAKIKELTQ
jgi:hypothetical protein